MKKLFLMILTMGLVLGINQSFSPAPVKQAKWIYTIADSGRYLYLTNSSTNDTPGQKHVTFNYIAKGPGIQISSQNNFIYIKDANGVMLPRPIDFSKDSLKLNGLTFPKDSGAVAYLKQMAGLGGTSKTLTTSTATQVKTGLGELQKLVIMTAGNGSVRLWDGTDSSGTSLGDYTTSSQGVINLEPGAKFRKGLYVKQSAASTVAKLQFIYY